MLMAPGQLLLFSVECTVFSPRSRLNKKPLFETWIFVAEGKNKMAGLLNLQWFLKLVFGHASVTSSHIPWPKSHRSRPTSVGWEDVYFSKWRSNISHGSKGEFFKPRVISWEKGWEDKARLLMQLFIKKWALISVW